MQDLLDLVPYALPLVGVWIGARMNRAAQLRLVVRQETSERDVRRREERRACYAELIVAVNRQIHATLSWHIARSEGAPDAPTLEREMYDAMADQRAARATVELVGSEPVRDAASDLANALVKGMQAAADGSFLDQVKREQTLLMLCMREDLGSEGSLRRTVGTNPPIAADAT